MLITETNTFIDDIPGIYLAGDKMKSAVVLTHGIMGSKNEYLDTLARISEQLEYHNIASFRFDFGGHGDSKRSLDSFSLSSQVSDLNKVISWMLSQGYKKISLMGISFGAPPVIISSVMNKGVIDKCFLIAPVLDYKSTFLFPTTPWGKEFFGLDKVIESLNKGRLYLEENGYYLSEQTLLDILLVDVPSFSSLTDVPFTIFHGLCDNMVPIAPARTLEKEKLNFELVEFSDTEHGLTEVNDIAFASEITRRNLTRVIDEVLK